MRQKQGTGRCRPGRWVPPSASAPCGPSPRPRVGLALESVDEGRVEPPRSHHVDGDAVRGQVERGAPWPDPRALPSTRCRRRDGRGRSPRTDPVKMTRPAPRDITRAAARAPRKVPVRFTSRTWRHTAGWVRRGPATTGEMPALQIHTSTPPHSATVASATDSLKSSSVTSPLITRVGPGNAAASSLRSASARATRATRAPAREKAWASSAPRPRLAPVRPRGCPPHLRAGERTLGSRWGPPRLAP